MKKLLVALAAVLVVLVLAVMVILFVTFDSPGFGRAVMERASAATGLTLRADRFRLKVSRGLMIEKLEAKGTVAGGTELDAKLDLLVLEHRLRPLLSGTLAVEQIVLERPDVELKPATAASAEKPEAQAPEPAPSGAAPAAGSSRETPPTSSGGGLDLQIKSIRLADATIKSTTGTSKATVDGLNLDLRDVGYDPKAVAVLHALSGKGELRVASTILGSLRISDLHGGFELGGGRFRIPSIELRLPEGPLQGEFAIDFNPSPFTYTLALTGEPIDVNLLVGTAKSGGGFGAGHLDVKGQGAGAASRGLAASGSIKLEKGTLPVHPVFTGILKVLGKPAEAIPYEATTARFRLSQDRIDLEPVRFETPKLGLELSGWANLAGPLSLDAAEALHGRAS